MGRRCWSFVLPLLSPFRCPRRGGVEVVSSGALPRPCFSGRPWWRGEEVVGGAAPVLVVSAGLLRRAAPAGRGGEGSSRRRRCWVLVVGVCLGSVGSLRRSSRGRRMLGGCGELAPWPGLFRVFGSVAGRRTVLAAVSFEWRCSFPGVRWCGGGGVLGREDDGTRSRFFLGSSGCSLQKFGSLCNFFVLSGPGCFESGGPNDSSNIDPWSIIGNESSIYVKTERSSCFTRNIIALRMEVLCDECPAGRVGIYNPGCWGMNIEEGKAYNLVMYIRSMEPVELNVSLTCSDGLQNMASATIVDTNVSDWRKIELKLLAQGTCRNSRLELTASKRGVIWIDQVSLMPSDTYKGHGFRKELMQMLMDLRPQFLRFPGGCFIEGDWLRNAFRWRETIGPWEERPGHYGDVWNYWTDDGLGYYEFLQLAEDLGAEPIWVFNAGISHHDEVNTTALAPFVKDALDSIEFARGSAESTWGSVRAAMGHFEQFPLKYVTVGNEDCEKKNYRGNYHMFYNAIREAYPDIQIISNCDGSSKPLDHPADLYDVHVYTSANQLFVMKDNFTATSRTGPRIFVSEYAVNLPRDAGNGTLLASLGEAAFLIGLEKNSDIVHMASYAPLFVNYNNRRWNPDAIVFNSWQQYGTPSYWMQTFFRESSGAVIHPVRLASSYSDLLAASAITWKDNGNIFLRIKIVNFGSHAVNLTISATGLQAGVDAARSDVTVLTSSDLLDENSFSDPKKVVPVSRGLPSAAEKMQALLVPHSLTSFDLALF